MKALLLLCACLILMPGAALAQMPQVPPDVSSEGSVTVGGQRVDYRAVAGTFTVHPKKGGASQSETAASMFYTAYFRKGPAAVERPLTFIYNGGPGASTLWLHIGAFGPKRVITRDAVYTPAPYKVSDNAYSLLDASDLVFIDAPATGFSRVWGPDQDRGFFGIDADAHAFGEFITAFLSRHGRWSSPKFLLGESYGTPRSAVLANLLSNEFNVDVNGVVLLSQILNYDLGMGASAFNPGTDQPYIVALPAYAAAAWYHNRLPGPRPATLQSFLDQVEQFATTEYAAALQAGASLDDAKRASIAQRLSEFTGLPAAYILESDLRLDARQFRLKLLDKEGLTVGGLDARFVGPHMDPMAKGAEYDPAMSAVGAAFVAGFNDYMRKTLGYGEGQRYEVSVDLTLRWAWDRPQPQGAPTRILGIANVLPDLASALKRNPALKVMVNGGYYDLGTPYFESKYEMQHLPMPPSLQDNIEYHYYPAGHMTFVHEPALAQMHANITDFIRRASAVK